MGATINGSLVINTCSTVDFSSIGNDSYADDSCTINAYSNDVAGFIVSLHGTDNGFYNSTLSAEWAKLATGTGVFDITPPNVEAWGWRIVNGTASEYSPGALDDTDNQPDPNDKFDNATYWHTVNYATSGGGTPYGDENFLEQDSVISPTAEFDLAFRIVSHNTGAGNYEDTVTVTITAQ